ncbi:MAG: hypothetical protein AAGF11_06290 [Myxococcota bacterium]
MSRFDSAIAAGFFAMLATPLVLDVLAWDTGVVLPGMRRATEVARIEPREWLDGAAAQKIEQTLVGGSLLSRWVAPHYNAAWYRALGRTPPAARVDDEGWIFATSRTAPLSPRRYDALVGMVPAMVRAAVDEVEAHGPRVVIALVPDRARLHPEHAYRGGVLPQPKRAYLPRLAAAMRAEGLTVIELEPALTELRRDGIDPFYRADHHWTSHGAQAGAMALARALRTGGHVPAACAEPGFEPGAKPDFEPFEVAWAEQAEATSLVRKLGLPAAGTLEGRWTRTYPRARLTRRGAWEPRQAPIVVVTTSYGKWGAPEWLANALGCPVAKAIRDGNSLTRAKTLVERIQRHADLSRARLVVWELLEYDLYSAADVPLGQDG